MRQTGLLELLNGRILRLSYQIVGNLGHAGRNVQRDDRALGLLRIGRRIGAYHLVFFDGCVVYRTHVAHFEAGGLENGLRVVLALVRHIRHRDRLRAGGEPYGNRGALGDLLAAPGILLGDCALRLARIGILAGIELQAFGCELLFDARLGYIRRGGEIRYFHHVGCRVALVQHEEHAQNDQQSHQTAHDGADDDLLLLACLRGLRTLFRTGFRGNAVLRVRYGLKLACDGIERLRYGRFAGRGHGHGIRGHFGLLACLHIGQIGQRIECGRHRHTAVHERQQIVLEFGSRGVTVLTILRHRFRANRIPHLRQSWNNRTWGSGDL